ncbi:MAG: hypothetical protein IJZ45_05235 [Bacteroidaceae bacterium]|nr:hypothetical protein [Bacteroidaceae bacterium]
MVVGEGGCPPEYFLKKMGVGEAADFIKGLRRRERSGWEQTRILATTVAKLMGAKDYELELPWDKEREDEDEYEETSAEELERLREKAREMERLMNGR